MAMNIDYKTQIMRYQPLKGTYIPVTVFDQQGTILGVLRFFGSDILYEEPVERCLHSSLENPDGQCSRCGAQQRWVVQVWPEVQL